MPNSATELAQRLAQQAEAVCRHYLSNGRREGRYWRVGDVRNTPGRSMYVRLTGATSGKGAAGKWTDSATAEHGDLLDVIRESCRLVDFPDVLDEARRFLNLPRSAPVAETQLPSHPGHGATNALSLPGELIASAASVAPAQRLFAISQPLAGTVAEAYLRGRGITALHDTGSLGFHSNCYYRVYSAIDGRAEIGTEARRDTWPALIAAVTDLDGAVTGVQRTYLNAAGDAPSRVDKAPVESPRRAMGHLLANGVRFGSTDDVMAAGEGIETLLSLRCALPGLPMIAALSAYHLGALLFPPTLRRLYVARDNDAAGDGAFAALAARAQEAGIEALALTPALRDFNDDLRQFRRVEFLAALRVQLVPEDVPRFMSAFKNTGTR